MKIFKLNNKVRKQYKNKLLVKFILIIIHIHFTLLKYE
jgi:hypothetical protein